MSPNMAISSGYLISLIQLFLLSLLVQCISLVCISSGTNGFSIKLIHMDSIGSPLYPGNLSFQDRLSRYHNQSLARLKRIQVSKAIAKNKTTDPNTIQPPIVFDGEGHLALVGIGTFNNNDIKPYYLVLDTGSSFTWTQCEGSDPSFPQNEPLYPYKNSATYQQVPCQHDSDCFDAPRFRRCDQGSCSYMVQYGDGSWTAGKSAREKFTFHSDNGGTETLDNFLFGCGFSQNNFKHSHPAVAGILGFGTGPSSLLHQLGDRARNRFSFCLQLNHNSILQFGDEAKFKQGQVPDVTQLTNFNDVLYLHVQDISIEGVRLNFPPGTFEVQHPSMKGGFVIDTGSALTLMREAEYKVVKDAFVKYFSVFPELHQVPHLPMDLCYEGAGFQSYPRMTLHFENGVDYQVGPRNLFTFDDYYFCLAMNPLPSDFDHVTVIFGDIMLTNRRFVFDLNAGEMAFARELCGQE